MNTCENAIANADYYIYLELEFELQLRVHRIMNGMTVPTTAHRCATICMSLRNAALKMNALLTADLLTHVLMTTIGRTATHVFLLPNALALMMMVMRERYEEKFSRLTTST